jgi:hypothetical protein
MSRKVSLIILTTVMMMFVSAIVFAKPNFSGSWLLNKDKSIGLQPGMDMSVTIKHEGDKIEAETKVVTAQGERVIKDTYILDGKEVDFTPQQPNSKGKRKAEWLPRGNGIMITDITTTETDKGTVTSQVIRKWILSPDGKELISDMFIDDQRGSFNIRRVFVKNTLQ